MMAPSVVLLLIWMIVPLAMTLWFSFQHYNLLNPIRDGFAGFSNYTLLLSPTRPSSSRSCNTLVLVVGVLLITVIGGIAARAAARPADVRPGHRAHPGDLALLRHAAGGRAGLEEHDHASRLRRVRRHRRVLRRCSPIDWFAHYPLLSIIIIVAWQWLPFATLILLTALQSLDGEQKEAAEMDGAGFVSRFCYLTLPHMSRAITVVILIQTIFLLGVYAEILVTTNGGPGYASTNLPFLIYRTALLELRRRRGLGRRHHRRHPRQHRRLLPDARRRQEPGQVREDDHGPRSLHPAQDRSSPSPPGSSPC